MIDGAIIAAVDVHGRARFARPLPSLLFLFLACAALAAQPPSTSSFQDLRRELSAKIAAAGATAVSIACRQTLRERVCSAEVVKDGAHDLIVVARPSGPGDASREPSLAIDMRPLFAQRTPILDAAPTADGARLVVLEPTAVSIRQRTAGGDVSDVVESRAVQTSRAWPRDLRGRISTAQTPFDVFLPGVSCRGDLDPLRVSCADESRPWPGLANGGLEAARNYFTTPEGRTFSSAAALGGDSAAAWIAADPQGGLVLLDDRRTVVAKLPTAGDDVAAIRASCSPSTFVVVSTRVAHEGDIDELRLFRVDGRQLSAVAPPLRLAGALTALWDSTAIVRDAAADRYEAFHLSVSCAR